jgi:radical SAM superfamily enzyme YgiQ (UPF0313 family)
MKHREKVLIINSPLFAESNPLYDEDSLPPIGLGYIATSLKNAGIDVELLDAVDKRISLAELISTANRKRPTHIALNIFTTNYHLVKDFVEAITFPVYFIIGGLATKELFDKIFDWNSLNPIDIVVGDGELIAPAIVLGRVDQLAFAAKPYRRAFKVDDSSNYLLRDISDVKLDRSFFENEPVIHPFGFLEANIIASRGCIYSCSFCAAARILNKEYPVRERTISSIRTELEQIALDYPEVTSIRVLDDLFLKTSKSVETAIEAFQGFAFQWRSMAHVMTFNSVHPDVMHSLKQSGCNELFIGIESGSPEILRAIRKTSDTEKIVANVSKVLTAGINVKGYFIYGFPNETEADMELTLELAKTLKSIADQNNVVFRTSVFQYRPYHGTEIYHRLAESGEKLDVERITPNTSLSSLVGRLQFNFHSGNYSKVPAEKVHDYIYRTTLLNGPEPFASRISKVKSKRA